MAKGKQADPDFELFAQIKAKSKAEGFREGYMRALFDVRHASHLVGRAFEEGRELELAGPSITASRIVASHIPAGVITSAPPAAVRAPRANSDQSRVLATITGTPGLRGVEIVQKLAAEDNPVQERTVRTALNRLKSRAQIEQREGGWYPVQAN